MQAPQIRNTADVQNLLDVNQKLINAILENMKLGKNDEAAKFDFFVNFLPSFGDLLNRFQEKLQQNLIQLAAIADGNSRPPNS